MSLLLVCHDWDHACPDDLHRQEGLLFSDSCSVKAAGHGADKVDFPGTVLLEVATLAGEGFALSCVGHFLVRCALLPRFEGLGTIRL